MVVEAPPRPPTSSPFPDRPPPDDPLLVGRAEAVMAKIARSQGWDPGASVALWPYGADGRQSPDAGGQAALLHASRQYAAHVVPPEDARTAAGGMGRGEVPPRNSDLVEFGRRTGANFVIAGNVDVETGPGSRAIRVHVTVVDVANGGVSTYSDMSITAGGAP